MTDGMLFLWFAWLLWIVVTFLMKKGKRRTYFACFLLLLIACSNVTLEIGGYFIQLSFIVLIVGLLFFHAIARSFYLLFASFTICLGYTAILFWEQITPIWIFLPRSLLIPIAIVVLTIIITKQFESRLAIGLIGLTCGEMYHSFILSSYAIQEGIGDKQYFDMLLTFVLFVTLLEVIQQGKMAIYALSQDFKQSIRKQKGLTQQTKNG
ncbi:YphA family membrane protein [Virgibacillus sp. FSP13]